MPIISIDSNQLREILEKTIDLFQDYQYKHGYDEPRARAEAIMDVLGNLISTHPGKP